MQEIINVIYYNAVPFILVLSVLVFVHELGHYLVARYNNVRVEVFSIGFGPEIIGWTNRVGMRWKISLIPLGGYVRMFSDLNAASQPDQQTIAQMSEADKSVSLFHKTVGQRIAISAAGPLANYLFAIILLSGLYISTGQRLPSEAAKIGHVAENTAAYRAGLQSNDIILEIDHKPVQRFTEMQTAIRSMPGKDLEFRIRRNHEDMVLHITPDAKKTLQGTIGVLGVTQGMDSHRLPVYQAPLQASLDVLKISWGTLSSFGQMLIGKQSAEGLSGPIGIASITSRAAQAGIIEVLWLAAFLSVSLGLINLLPVPVLDGGHLLFYGIEAIRGKPVSERVQEIGYKIGFSLIMLLLLVSTWNDISNIKAFNAVRNLFN